jgi:hypothetical protein
VVCWLAFLLIWRLAILTEFVMVSQILWTKSAMTPSLTSFIISMVRICEYLDTYCVPVLVEYVSYKCENSMLSYPLMAMTVSFTFFRF